MSAEGLSVNARGFGFGVFGGPHTPGQFCDSRGSGLLTEFRQSGTPHPGGLSTREVQELLDFLASGTARHSRRMVSRPRTIALFSGRAAAGWPRDVDDRILAAHVREVGATHLVVDRASPQGAELDERVFGNPQSVFERPFSNTRFVVFAAR